MGHFITFRQISQQDVGRFCEFLREFVFLKYFLFVYGGILSFPKGRGVPRPGAGCLRRDTFFPWRKKVSKERHSRGKGFRFPFPLENPPSLKRPKREGCGPPSLETPSRETRLRARGRIPTPVCTPRALASRRALARNDTAARRLGRTGSSAPTEEHKEVRS